MEETQEDENTAILEASTPNGLESSDNAWEKREQELCGVIDELNKRLAEHEEKVAQLERNCSRLGAENKTLEGKVDGCVKQKEAAIREKESMVMKYAVSEKSLIQYQNVKEQAEKRLKEAIKENELMQYKLSQSTTEKARICQLLDNKSYELKSSQQELERTKSDLGSLETKLKWSQNSLKNEIELRKESEGKVETLNAQIQDYVSDAEKAKKDAAETIKEFYTSQDNRAHILDQQVKELQASQILLTHERNVREQQIKTLQNDLERLQRKQNDTLHENNGLSMMVQQLENQRAELEVKLSELKAWANQQRQDAADLQTCNVQLDQLKLQLTHEQEHLVNANDQIAILKQRNADLLAEMESCRTHEAELLSFTHQLTDKNVRLQSEFTALETKVQQLSCEQALLKRNVKEHETKAGLLSTQLVEERSKTSEEILRLKGELNVTSKRNVELAQEVADQKGENLVIKRKLELSLKEANKELQHLRKKQEQYENSEKASSSGSSTSLNNVERPSPTNTEHVKVIQPEVEVDKQTLIDHIVKLQRTSARKSEKIDFLEEHVKTLVGELQKKSRLLQNYIKREQDGVLSSNKMDSNKANLAKHSGIMASMYGAKVADENLTLEQSLDINRKLYAILEDALLKNITLKENIDTLGAEIDRLKTSSSSSN